MFLKWETKFQVQLFHNGLKSLCYEWWSVSRHTTRDAKDCCSQELQTTVRWTFNSSWVSLDRTGEPQHWSCRNMPPCLTIFWVWSLWPIGHQIPSRKCFNDNIPGRNVVGELSQRQPFMHVPWQFHVLSTVDIRLHMSRVGTFELYTSSAGLTFQRMAPGVDRCMKWCGFPAVSINLVNIATAVWWESSFHVRHHHRAITQHLMKVDTWRLFVSSVWKNLIHLHWQAKPWSN